MNPYRLFLLWMAGLWLSIAAPLRAQSAFFEDSLRVDGDSISVVDSLVADTLVAAVWPQNLQQKLDMLLEDRLFQTSQVGLMVYDLTADSLLYAHRERQLMRPASTMKLITAITGIDKLSGSFRLKTQLRYSGRIQDGVLTGNLYAVGGLDPMFNNDDLNAFVERIHALGIDTVRGKVVKDNSMKDKLVWGEGWCWDDDNPNLVPLLLKGKDRFAESFERALREAHIVVEQGFVEGTTPAGSQEVCTRSHTLDQLLMRMMKESDNLYAEALFYQIGYASGTKPATAKAAAALVKRLIAKFGFQPGDYKIADGSGLSLYDYLTPQLEVAFLRYAYQNQNIYIHLLPSLPIAGKDGTLKKRMHGTVAANNVKAKTGTVTAVSCLAGYCTAANGHLLCFSIMNNGLASISKGRQFQDRVCVALCE